MKDIGRAILLKQRINCVFCDPELASQTVRTKTHTVMHTKKIERKNITANLVLNYKKINQILTMCIFAV